MADDKKSDGLLDTLRGMYTRMMAKKGKDVNLPLEDPSMDTPARRREHAQRTTDDTVRRFQEVARRARQ